MILAARTQMLSHKYSVPTMLKKYKEMGYKGVEICLEDLNFNVRPDLLEPYSIEHIKQVCAEQEITITSVSNHKSCVYDDFIYEYLKKCIRITKTYGSDIFITAVTIDPRIKANDKQAAWKKTVERMKGLVEVAEDCGVKLAIEPEMNAMIKGTQDFINLCNEIDSPSLTCNFDMGHAFLTDKDVCQSIIDIRDKIVHCHVEDMGAGEHIHLIPGDGDMDLPMIFKTLKDIGFDGGLALDLYHYDYEQVAPIALEKLKQIINRSFLANYLLIK